MENLLFYFLKVNAILSLFYVVYYLLLRKETFFQANRLFLLGGIVSAFVIPLLSYSKVIWIEPTPINYNKLIPVNNSTENISAIPEVANFDWNFLFIILYGLIVTFLLTKLLIEVISFISVVKSGNKNKVNKVILVETSSFENPFSFFNYLVYNKSTFTKEELEFILTHENVHIKQLHSIDVLIGKLTTLLLWINPIAWLYRKAMLQNLEFIADAETTKEIQNSYNYQKTLLKSVCNQNQLSITNQFYQSLIKKRIVMLNTKPSNKRNAWKYSIILPALVGFFVLFQVKTIAQVKEVKLPKVVKEFQEVNRVEFMIDKNTTDQQIKEETDLLKKEHDVIVKVSKVKRNTKKEITGLKINYKDNKGNKGSNQINGDEPIEPIVFYKETKNGNSNMGLTTLPFPKKMKRMAFHSKDKDNMVIDIDVDNEIEWISKDDENIFFESVNPQKKIIVKIDSLDNVDPIIISEAGDGIEKIIAKKMRVIQNEDENQEIIIESLADGDETIFVFSEFNEDGEKAMKIQKEVMEKMKKKMKKMKFDYDFEWKDEKPHKMLKIEKQEKKAKMEIKRAEMEAIKAELEKTKEELEKLKSEIRNKKIPN